MIYALVRQYVDRDQRKEIAEAIKAEDRYKIQTYESEGVIVHVRDARDKPSQYYCIYCKGIVEKYPRVDKWYFKHKEINGCLGTSNYLGIENPRRHGCYITEGSCLGCKTIAKGTTYCNHFKRT